MNALDLLQTVAPQMLDQDTVRSGGLAVKQLLTQDASEALEQLRSFIETQQASGWLRWLDKSETQTIQQASDLDHGNIPYCGEFVSTDGSTSLHLRFCDGRYTIQKLTCQPDADGLLVTENRLGANAAAGKTVLYEIHWQLDESANPSAYLPATARFAGFENA